MKCLSNIYKPGEVGNLCLSNDRSIPSNYTS